MSYFRYYGTYRDDDACDACGEPAVHIQLEHGYEPGEGALLGAVEAHLEARRAAGRGEAARVFLGPGGRVFSFPF